MLVLDNNKGEVGRFNRMLEFLGFRAETIDRVGVIGERLVEIRQELIHAPKLLVVDLSWDFRHQTFALLNRPDVRVPSEPERRGWVMWREVLSSDPAVRGVPSLILSNFLDDQNRELSAGIAEARRSGVVVTTMSKLALEPPSGLLAVIRNLELLGLLEPLAPEALLDEQVGVNIDHDLLQRAMSVLGSQLDVSLDEFGEHWPRISALEGAEMRSTFQRIRIAFKILTAARTVFGVTNFVDQIGAEHVLVPGSSLRACLIDGSLRPLMLIKAELERRVGGPL